ncbi:MAG TPA: hypothetical protein PKV55_09005 [Nitrospira sp.]|jgi:hypothetical protein|nr:hypothetical protein [Nitrospira sp.]MBS0172485.1 hypothetical protein [Nitrospira sp.]MBS0179331.1 hypothetical protein [Nitrospira sp.]MBX3339216.1 hypothetical protein [Nitrospira sp.]MCW5778136.1 hypothetical protein [Nitrospira sp.]
MMDLSSVLDAALAVMGAITVLSMGLWTLSSESSTVSTSQEPSAPVRVFDEVSLPKAA